MLCAKFYAPDFTTAGVRNTDISGKNGEKVDVGSPLVGVGQTYFLFG